MSGSAACIFIEHALEADRKFTPHPQVLPHGQA